MTVDPVPTPRPRGTSLSGVARLQALRDDGRRIVMLTCYDASFAGLCSAVGVDTLLVGDSLGMVIQGESSTVPVTVEQMRYHVACVARGAASAATPSPVLVADLPFGSYHASPHVAQANAATLMQAGAEVVKVEGAGRDNGWLFEVVAFLVDRGIPVCGHLGLTPQSVAQLGGYRVQGRGDDAAERLLADALALERAGASMLVLEMVPSALAARITGALRIPTIGIGAGPGCSGQVLVLHDLLGVYPGRKARFVRDFTRDADGTVRGPADAIRAYVDAVRDGSFPAPEHTFD